ncbi:MAG: hypothetical protein A4E45_01302 [Methanosaeta sp. PtaB.Bin039]|nr:MAG: hypothetical protein A4E45_01302 [Methanosaeta sp. PtaB.Bin039]HOT06423.1 hypothetical protein [Methanotrichaceae archaeon]HQF16194.1 hypothetical protein [Methanotrichaceae archaeon]HQI90930.1 hypothetical protein [Methanotrichaceae archaeon]HQJ28352.1 hypothetical protein [Methanotrichaceae archaeon]
MRYGILLLLAVVLTASSAHGLFESLSLDYYIDRYNTNIDQAPVILKTILGSEQVEIRVALDNGSLLDLGIETDMGSIISVSYSGIADPSIAIETSEQTIDEVIGSPDPIGAFQQARDRGDIMITANKIPGKIKVSSLLSSMEVLRFFYQRVFALPA